MASPERAGERMRNLNGKLLQSAKAPRVPERGEGEALCLSPLGQVTSGRAPPTSFQRALTMPTDVSEARPCNLTSRTPRCHRDATWHNRGRIIGLWPIKVVDSGHQKGKRVQKSGLNPRP